MMSEIKKHYKPVNYYFVADPSYWPLISSFGLFFIMLGIVNMLHHNGVGPYLFLLGAFIIVFTMYGWFSTVVRESLQGLHSQQMDRTYRWGIFLGFFFLYSASLLC